MMTAVRVLALSQLALVGLLAATCLAQNSGQDFTQDPAERVIPHASPPAMTPSGASAAAPAAVARGRRVALVVGAAKYVHVAALANPANDAVDVSAALQRLGFEVETLVDPDRSTLEAAVRRYGDRSIGADASVFHYSGHALEVDGRNWLMPVSADIKIARDLRFEAVDLGSVFEQTDGAARIAIVLLDACRDNPFARRLTGSDRSFRHGLARIDVTATGVLVAFAAAPGQVALDGDGVGRNSPFTTAVLRHIETRGLEIKTLMSRVTREVVEATKGKQRPWQNSSLEGDFYFLPAPGDAVLPTAQPAVNVEVVFWDSVKSSRDPADFRAYLAKFPKGEFVDLARNRLAMLQRQASQDLAKSLGVETTAPAAAPPVPSVGSSAAGATFREQLLARLAALSVPADNAQERARDYEADAGHKAIAVAPMARRTYRRTRWSTAEAAEMATLESCQIHYGEPCTLVAVDDKVVPESGQSPARRNMPRTRYADRFEPERIPGAGPSLLQRADVLAYRSSQGAKAAAYHPWGRLFVATGAVGQLEAEEQALARCNADPDRNGRDGSCYLYAAGNRVVLPQRLTRPRVLPRTISEAFAYLGVPRYSYDYFSEKGHKAIAIAIESNQTFWWGGRASAADAEEHALEGCALTYHTACVLLASDDTLQGSDPWKAPRRTMPRLQYAGSYKSDSVPMFSGAEQSLRGYAALAAPKAMAIRPVRARVRTATGATAEEAQVKALAACNEDVSPFPCFVYAIGDRVVLGERRTEPLR